MSIKHQLLAGSFLLISILSFSQKKQDYPSLLWEITGNGLSRPSYLFGTMHVSSKLAFHLSDSFYIALKNVEVVALELNPEVWQGQIAELDKLKMNYASFAQPAGNDIMTAGSFRIHDYTNLLQAALKTEPSVVNNLLHRSYKAREDFEEDTFLDMYIYQTGRKLGKRPAGLEDYYESEKLVLEAYGDMAREKKKKNIDLDGRSYNDIFEKLQNAYRRGDLDMMDSLDNIMDRSDAFKEKFLFVRNEIQANSIDSIIKKASLFAGVGAAHLPGKRGIIELLRQKGYKMRPVIMQDRDAASKTAIDSLKVPVSFQRSTSDDGVYSVEAPGELYNISNEYLPLDRKQYADMSNGSYYIVTRVKSHSFFLNQTEDHVMRKIDSLLYENIPGKILEKKRIVNNKYPGYNIISRTRRGDLQRYNIFVTPFEIIVFKMSGKENYVSGKEADQFFNSIQLKPLSKEPVNYTPVSGGFAIKLPHQPHEIFIKNNPDRWEYEAADAINNTAFLIIRKKIYNFSHIDEDSIMLAMMDESFFNEELFDKKETARLIKHDGKKILETKHKLKDGSPLTLRMYNNGADYVLVAIRSAKPEMTATSFNSFSFVPYKYSQPVQYRDTFLNMIVSTPVIPKMDEGLRSIYERSADDIANGHNPTGYISYWPKLRTGNFESPLTGELVNVQVQKFPKYFYIKDSAKYWQNEINELRKKEELQVRSVEPVKGVDFFAVNVTLVDTGSRRMIRRMVAVKHNFKFIITSLQDSTSNSAFADDFFRSFRPYQPGSVTNVYSSKLSFFFEDLFSKDSSTRTRARQGLQSVYYGVDGIPYIRNAISSMNVTDKEYYDIKSKLIAELGYIKDTTGTLVVPLLKELYKSTADTSLFQNEVIKALARLQTKEAYIELSTIMQQDPPVFNNEYDIQSIFRNFKDTLQLSARLFPGILNLATLDDYEAHIHDLLVEGVDSGYLNKEVYKSYFPAIMIDAKVELKKQRNRDEKARQAEADKKDKDENARIMRGSRDEGEELRDYSKLLIPFYENKEVQQYFQGLLSSLNDNVRLHAVVTLLKHKRSVPDSIIHKIAGNEKYSALLYEELSANKLQSHFPAKFATQIAIARSYLVMENQYEKLDSLIFLEKRNVSFKGKQGNVYFFKYKIHDYSDWKLGVVGIQPINEKDIAAPPLVSSLTETRIKKDMPLREQLDAQLKKEIFGLYKSGKAFYSGRDD